MAQQFQPKQFHEQELNLKLIDAVSAALRDVRAVHLGDTNHTNNSRLFKWLAEPKTMKSFAKDGVKILCLEIAREEQMLADAIALDLINDEEFNKYSGSTNIHRDVAESHAEEANIIRAAAKEKIRVIFADPSNGKPALKRYCAAMNKVAGKEYSEEQWFNNDFANGIIEREVAKLNELKKTDRAKADEAFYVLTEQLKEATRHFERHTSARRDDRTLARHIAKMLPAEGKAIIVYGAGHYGNEKTGLHARLAAHGVPSLKIDVFADRSGLKHCFSMYADGLLKANGAYILSQGRFKPAVSLPEAVIKRLG